MNDHDTHADNNEANHRDWTDHDLERYHDGDLPENECGILTDYLRCDSALRARLTTVGRVDEWARQALESVAIAPDHSDSLEAGYTVAASIEVQAADDSLELQPSQSQHWRVTTVAAAALFLLVGTTVIMWWALASGRQRIETGTEVVVVSVRGHGDGANEPTVVTPQSRQLVRSVERTGSTSKVNIVYDGQVQSEKVRRPPAEKSQDLVEQDSEAQRVARHNARMVNELGGAIRRGDVARSLALLDVMNDFERTKALQHVGSGLLSAQTARAVLEGLTPGKQLEVCQIWAADAQLRPVTFERLRAISREHPELRQEVSRLVTEMNRKPNLRKWIRSYELDSLVINRPAGPADARLTTSSALT